MVDPQRIIAKRKAAAAQKTTAAPTSRRAARDTFANAKNDGDARAMVVRLTFAGIQKRHASQFSRWQIGLPSGRETTYMLPLASAKALETAGFPVKLVGRLNEDDQ